MFSMGYQAPPRGAHTMDTYSTRETILIGLLTLLAIFWFSPGIKAAIERGKQVEANRATVLITLSDL